METLQTDNFLTFIGFFRHTFFLLIEVIEATDNEDYEKIKISAKEFNDEWEKIYFPLNAKNINNSFRESVIDEINKNLILLNEEQLKKYKLYISNYLIKEFDLFQSLLNDTKNNFIDLKQLFGVKKINTHDEIDTIEDAILFYSNYFYLFLGEWQSVETRIFDLIDYKRDYEELRENEPIPANEFKRETQKITWLYELGILQTVLQKCNNNYYRTANIIQSFTDLKTDTIRKGLEAIFKPNDGNKKNNPLNNPNNLLFLSEMRRKYKLDE